MSYSSFFSSGLSAVQHMSPPSSPANPDSPILPFTSTLETATDVANQDQTPVAANPSQGFDVERPKLRKRRSSLTVNTSPLVQLKGSYRGAATATQRQNRSRSGSINNFPQPCSVGFPIEETGIIGRLRSGSVGNSLRCATFFCAFTSLDAHGVFTSGASADPVVPFEAPGHRLRLLCLLCQSFLPLLRSLET